MFLVCKDYGNLRLTRPKSNFFFQAGIALSCWFLKNKDRIKNKFVLELGSGTGLSGIAACINCEPQEYWFTDCHSTVMENLKQNIRTNESRHEFNCIYKIMQISWNYIDNFNMFHMKTPDLLIAAGIFNVCLKTVENFYMNYCFRCDI